MSNFILPKTENTFSFLMASLKQKFSDCLNMKKELLWFFFSPYKTQWNVICNAKVNYELLKKTTWICPCCWIFISIFSFFPLYFRSIQTIDIHLGQISYIYPFYAWLYVIIRHKNKKKLIIIPSKRQKELF